MTSARAGQRSRASRTQHLFAATAVAAIPVVLAASACASAPSLPASSSASPPPPASAPCRTSELKISLGPGGVAAGTWAALLEFTNTGNAPCTMTGWPGVAGITSSGTASPAKNRSDAMDGLNATGTPHVTLQPGGKAGIDISGTDNAASGGNCPAPYPKLRVSAPGDSTTVTVTATTSALSTGLPSCSPLAASPVHPLSDFSFTTQ